HTCSLYIYRTHYIFCILRMLRIPFYFFRAEELLESPFLMNMRKLNLDKQCLSFHLMHINMRQICDNKYTVRKMGGGKFFALNNIKLTVSVLFIEFCLLFYCLQLCRSGCSF